MDKRDDYLARHRLGLATSETKLTLGRHLAGWLDTKRPPHVRPSTWIGYQRQVEILRPLWPIGLAKLTPNDVRRHVRALTDERFSPASVRANLVVLRMALRQAVNDGLLTRNVASLVQAPRVERRELHVLAAAELRRFLAATETDPHGALWALLLMTGLRIGEALALRWSDLDLAAGTLAVSGSLRPVDRRIRRPGQVRLDRMEPKTAAGWRTIALPPIVNVALARRREANAGAKAASIAGYVFTTSRGTPVEPRRASRLFNAFLAQGHRRSAENTCAGCGQVWPCARTGALPALRLHDLRHNAASLMLASGASLDDVKRYLGHSQIAVTSDVYGHLVEGRSAEVAAGIDRAVR